MWSNVNTQCLSIKTLSIDNMPNLNKSVINKITKIYCNRLNVNKSFAVGIEADASLGSWIWIRTYSGLDYGAGEGNCN